MDTAHTPYLTEVLRPELLHEVLCCLDARCLGVVASACRVMMPLTDEAQRRPHLVAKLGPIESVVGDCLPTLPASPSMGILFTDDYRGSATREVIEKAIKPLPPFTTLVGALSPSLQVQVGSDIIAGGSGPAKQGAMMLGRFPDAQFRSFFLDMNFLNSARASDEQALLAATGLLEPEEGASFSSSSSSSSSASSSGATPPDWKVFCVYVAGDGGRLAQGVVAALQARYPSAAIIGGIAQGAFRRAPGKKVEYDDDCVVGLAMAGNVPLQALVTRGVRPLGGAHVVTECEPVTTRAGTELLLLQNCRPAADDDDGGGGGGGGGGTDGSPDPKVMSAFEDAYRRMDNSGMGMAYIGVKTAPARTGGGEKEEEEEEEEEEDQLGEAEGYMLYDVSNDMFQQGAVVIPDPYRNSEEGPSSAAEAEARNDRRMAAWKSGERYLGGKLKLRFYQLDAAHCLSDAEQQLVRAKEQLTAQGRELMGALMFSCGGRGPHAFAGKAMMDATAFNGTFPEVPMAGFYAGGEIGPQAMADASGQVATQTGNAALQGFTCVWGLFSVPTKQRRDGSYLPSTIDTSSAALAGYLSRRDTPMDEVKRNAAAEAAAEAAAAAKAKKEAATKAAVAAAKATAEAAKKGDVPSAETIDSELSIKQLRALITSAELSHADCLEKADLRSRAKEAASILMFNQGTSTGAGGPPPPPPPPEEEEQAEEADS